MLRERGQSLGEHVLKRGFSGASLSAALLRYVSFQLRVFFTMRDLLPPPPFLSPSNSQEVPVKHVIVNKVIEEEVQEGYVQRLSKGQAVGVVELQEVGGHGLLVWYFPSLFGRSLGGMGVGVLLRDEP